MRMAPMVFSTAAMAHRVRCEEREGTVGAVGDGGGRTGEGRRRGRTAGVIRAAGTGRTWQPWLDADRRTID